MMNNNIDKSERITIWGIVQGVGFRPFIVKLADSMNICGNIKNMGGFVRLTINSTLEKTDLFIKRIQREKPAASEIVRIEREEIPFIEMDGFTIEESEIEDAEIGMIPADMAICDDCLKEFYNPNDRRYLHPFISCMVCGPRYTIIDSLPYDRINTTMRDFPMCDFCKGQYGDRQARRYHSQTISCHDCGPMPEYHMQSGEIIRVKPNDSDRTKAVEAAAADINGGRVIALKGTGGYYFVCSPFNDKAVKDLRKIKVREEKPFAIMFGTVEDIRKYCIVGTEEEELLKSDKRPIVLLEKKDNPAGREISYDVCRSSRYTGAFLPGFGLQYQLIEETGPLIMTSANLSDLPIIFNDDEMLELVKMQPKLAGVLTNGRKIIRSLDDSVARVIDSKPQLIRRSKGYTPVPIYVKTSQNLNKTHRIFAAGGQLKSAFAISKGNFSYVSQYLGDLDSTESQSVYEENLAEMESLFGIEPDLVICDMHPLYYTGHLAQNYIESRNKLRPENEKIELLKVQHHHAHTASVMAECGLPGPIIGVSFDGTGYGTDGNIWGGEFLICQNETFERYSHLKYIRMVGGDSSMKEGWKSAICHCIACEQNHDTCSDKGRILDISEIIDYSINKATLSGFNDRNMLEAAVRNEINTIETSSMGRLFDAVASLLGIHHFSRYEGECAIMLENAAYNAMRYPGEDRAGDLALKFHEDVAEFILAECLRIREDRNINDVALSGGVFQNKILMEKTLKLLGESNFQIYYNSAVPSNDGGIALGQNLIGMYHLSSR